MGDTNHFSGIIKILENPVSKFILEKTLITTFRVEISQNRQNKIVSVIFWGKLANEIKNNYKINDYLLIEGYISIKKKSSEVSNKKLEKTIITVLKIYPFLLQ